MIKSPFDLGRQNKQSIITDIPEDVQIVFVSDAFAEDFIGGAELTSQAIIDASPFSVFKLKSKDVNMKNLESGHEKFWIFGNFTTMDLNLIPSIVANMKYAILEYDYKFCRHRSIEKHEHVEGSKCECETNPQGKMISAFYYGAKSLWWMSERQLDKYLKLFPFLEEKNNVILSSVFDDKFFLKVKLLKEENKDIKRSGWVVLGSDSWIKGADNAVIWCEENKKDYEVLWNIPYDTVLEKLSKAKGFVYLPKGGDTCPRMVIEAKLLGCELELNKNVEHAEEIWFDTDDEFDTEAYLYAARERFWNSIKDDMNFTPSISGYTTTLNCIEHSYPWHQSIESLLGFCNEVVVVDGGSHDGTWEELKTWAETEEKLNVHQEVRDWNHPRFAVFDGRQKALARELCTGDFCWQQDADEIVHENDYEKISRMTRFFPVHVDIVSLPVVEYWGGPKKVRVDVNPWKSRLSRNNPNITHGIPSHFQKFDNDGNEYAAPGTDGCDYIYRDTLDFAEHASFYTDEVHRVRMHALRGTKEAISSYEDWFNRNVDLLPGVHHYSWFDLERKIKTYRDYWSRHWKSLYDISQEDTPKNNMFFDKCWKDVSDKDIKKLAKRLGKEMGGWIFHEKVDFSDPTPHITLKSDQPAVMKNDK
jgi:glycosyltransferase involved in cell wall biosynthesis